jgi:hypothetical protein
LVFQVVVFLQLLRLQFCKSFSYIPTCATSREERTHTVRNSQRCYRGAHKPFNYLANCTLKYGRDSFITYRVFKSFRNETLHVQCRTHNAVIPSCKLTGRFKSERERECFRLTDFWTTLYTKRASDMALIVQECHLHWSGRTEVGHRTI